MRAKTMKPSTQPLKGGGRRAPKTFKAAVGHSRRGAPKTARTTGRRGLHDLLEIYQGLSGFNANTMGLQEYKTTYGEMTEAGIQALSNRLSQYAPANRFPATQRAFYDLGCGVGRIVVGVAILHPEIQAKGIEIVPDRIRWARQALERIRTRQVANRIQFNQGSFLDPNLNLGDACWIFISNLCFDEATNRKLAEKIGAEVKPGTCIICSRELPFSGTNFEKLDSAANIPMTWSATSTCHVYRRKI